MCLGAICTAKKFIANVPNKTKRLIIWLKNETNCGWQAKHGLVQENLKEVITLVHI